MQEKSSSFLNHFFACSSQQFSLTQKNKLNKIVVFIVPNEIEMRLSNKVSLFYKLLEELQDLKQDFSYLGSLRSLPFFSHEEDLTQKAIQKFQQSLYQGDNLPISILGATEYIAQEVSNLNSHESLFVISSEQAISYSLIKNWLLPRRQTKMKVAIIHFDAYEDNDEHSSELGINSQSWIHALNHLIDSQKEIIQIGLTRIKNENSSVTQFSSSFIKDNIELPLEQIHKKFDQENIQEVYISFDINCLDQSYAGCTVQENPRGLAPHQCIYLIKGISQKAKITGVNLAQIFSWKSSSYTNPLATEPYTTITNTALVANALMEAINHGD